MSNLFLTPEESPDSIHDHIWQKLRDTTAGDRSEMKIATLATVAADYPQQRSVVLRDVDPQQRQLIFFTDGRSEKITELGTNPKVGLHFWDKELDLQLRMNGSMRALQNGPLAEKYFKEVPQERYAEYGTRDSPGSHLKNPEEEYVVSEKMAERHFTVLQFSCLRLEALQLNGDHHYRIEFLYTEGDFSAQWLMP